MIKEYLAYLHDNPQGYWFKRKLYGWGWIPATWQGWLVLAGYLAVIVICSFFVDQHATVEDVLYTFLLPVFLLTALLFGVCYKKGEPPRWQWGLPPQKNGK